MREEVGEEEVGEGDEGGGQGGGGGGGEEGDEKEKDQENVREVAGEGESEGEQSVATTEPVCLSPDTWAEIVETEVRREDETEGTLTADILIDPN